MIQKTDNQSLITIVIPVYNTSQYLDRCVNSVQNQTYRNIEILLIDDCSNDQSGRMCDQYQSIDKRITVIHHKENKGLAEVRNTALKNATGEWIGWVDSDDFVELDMFESLYNVAIKEKAEIVICGLNKIQNGKIIIQNNGLPHSFDSKAGLKKLIEDIEIQNYMCDKLFRHDLFDGIRFPSNRVFEDISTTYKLFEKATRIHYTGVPKYNYCLRDNNIVNNETLEYKFMYFSAIDDRYIDLKGKINDQELIELMEYKNMKYAIHIFANLYVFSKLERNENINNLKDFLNRIKKYPKQFDYHKYKFGKMQKLVLPLLLYPNDCSLFLAKVINQLYFLKNGSWL